MFKPIRIRIAVSALALIGAAALWPGISFATIPVINLAQPQAKTQNVIPVINLAKTANSGTQETSSWAGQAALRVPHRGELYPRGPEVAAAQRVLDKDGAALKVDGVMGQRTMTALLNYQSDHGLAINGALDHATRDMMKTG